MLSITQPKIIKQIHEEFLEAGADIIETNTFSSNKIAQDDYNRNNHAHDLNFMSAKIAKEAQEVFK